MDIQKIKALIDVLAASDLAELELEEGENRIRLVRRLQRTYSSASEPAAVQTAGSPASSSGAVQVQDPAEAVGLVAIAQEVRAPLYGVLHLTPRPGAPTFVQIGDVVQAGQILCLIEAMKMFHEVRAERAGRIVGVLAVAGHEVDEGAAIFQTSALI